MGSAAGSSARACHLPESGIQMPNPLAVLRYRGYVAYATARFCTTLCWQMLSVAVGWQVYAVTHNPLDLGYLGLVQFLPFLTLVLPGGHTADRLDRRPVVSLRARGGILHRRRDVARGVRAGLPHRAAAAAERYAGLHDRQPVGWLAIRPGPSCAVRRDLVGFVWRTVWRRHARDSRWHPGACRRRGLDVYRRFQRAGGIRVRCDGALVRARSGGGVGWCADAAGAGVLLAAVSGAADHGPVQEEGAGGGLRSGLCSHASLRSSGCRPTIDPPASPRGNVGTVTGSSVS